MAHLEKKKEGSNPGILDLGRRDGRKEEKKKRVESKKKGMKKGEIILGFKTWGLRTAQYYSYYYLFFFFS